MKNKIEITVSPSGTVLGFDHHDSRIIYFSSGFGSIKIDIEKNKNIYSMEFSECIEFNILNMNINFIVSEIACFSTTSIPIENDVSIGLFSLYASRAKFSDIENIKNYLSEKYPHFSIFQIMSVCGETISILCRSASVEKLA